jgi:hypothetical protein
MRELLSPVESTIWSSLDGFALYWGMEGVDDLRVKLELSDEHSPVKNQLHAAAGPDELVDVLNELIETVRKVDGAESLTVGVASAKDVPGRFEKKAETERVEPTELDVLTQKLQAKAAEFNNSGDHTGHIHTMCVTKHVRNVWGGVVPDGLSVRTDRVDDASFSEFEFEDFDLEGNKQQAQYTVETFRELDLGAFGGD